MPIRFDRRSTAFLTDCRTGVAGYSGITINADEVKQDLNKFSLFGVPSPLHRVVVSGNVAKCLLMIATALRRQTFHD